MSSKIKKQINFVVKRTYHRKRYGFAIVLLTSAVPCKKVSFEICGQQRPRSACAFAQSDQAFPCPLTASLDTTECMSG